MHLIRDKRYWVVVLDSDEWLDTHSELYDWLKANKIRYMLKLPTRVVFRTTSYGNSYTQDVTEYHYYLFNRKSASAFLLRWA